LTEPIWTTAEDIESERAEIRRLRAEEDRKWESLRRTVANVRRWETRLKHLEEELESLRRIGWTYLTAAGRLYYVTLRDRLIPVARVRLLYWTDEREAIIIEIRRERETRIAEEERLKRKRIIIVKQLVHAKIIIYSVVSACPPKKYTKRFQAFYNVDAIRDPETGKLDYGAKLTEKEIEACMDAFYSFWNWAYKPPEASEPVWIESGVWEKIDKPQGADVKQLSVRENEEEVFSKHFVPPIVLYEPTKKEEEEMMKLVQR